jgi:4-methyl-5(b-hydroxyethyl)-thiazole monophosphate biosynthesis
MSKKALVILANGFEEIEAICPIDILRRANIDVTVAGLESIPAQGAHGVDFSCDAYLEDLTENLFDAVILPGGMPGSQTLGESKVVQDICKRHYSSGGIIAAICAAPALALAKFGLLNGKNVTGFPGTESHFDNTTKYHKSEMTVQDGNIITSRGAGTAFSFGLKLVEALKGLQLSEELAQKMQYASQG